MPASAQRLTSPAAGFPPSPAGQRLMGTATLVRMAYEGRDLDPVISTLATRAAKNPFDAAALFDLSILLQAIGQRDKALEIQASALATCRRFTRLNNTGDGLRVLVIATHGDLMANTPIDFLLETSNAHQELIFVDAATADLDDLPAHDVAFMAVGEAPENAAVLARLEALLASWPGPIMNNAPARVRALTRDGVARLFEGSTHVLAPTTVQVSRAEADALARGTRPLESFLPGASYPLIVRPIGTHAGTGLDKVASPEALLDYLAREQAASLYLAPFIDYASADGLYRKQRIAFIDGVPYASHLAISEHWIVHYLSAGMMENAARRAEEALWMERFETDTARRMAKAFAEVQRAVGLDYFAIDCAEMPDGRLLLFEADVAMIVHALDGADLFPYKKPAMDRLFKAFHSALESRSRTRTTRA